MCQVAKDVCALRLLRLVNYVLMSLMASNVPFETRHHRATAIQNQVHSLRFLSGAMYAAFAMIQITGILCGSVFFTTMYNISMEWMLGFVFIMAAIFCSVTVILAR